MYISILIDENMFELVYFHIVVLKMAIMWNQRVKSKTIKNSFRQNDFDVFKG